MASGTQNLQLSGEISQELSREITQDSGFLEGSDSYDNNNDTTDGTDFGTMQRICSCPRPIYIRKSLPYVDNSERKGPCNMTQSYCDRCGGLRAGPNDSPLCQRLTEDTRCPACGGSGVTRDQAADQTRCADCFGHGVAVLLGPDGSPLSPMSHTFDESSVRRLRNPLGGMDEEERRFCTYKVEYIMKDIFERKLKHVRYDPSTCSRLSHDLCTMIKEKTKSMEFERYKLVVQVIVGQDTEDSVQIASRCLWDQDTDNFAAATFRNSNMYAVGIVYGMHLD